MIKNLRFSFFIILATFIASCSDDIASIDDNKLTVQQQAMLQEQGDKIRQAYEHGLIVSDITYIENASRDIEDEKGWLITFSDGTTEKLIDVEKCATPYLKMDAEGHWMVSFDTKSFQYLLDENREKVKASLGDNSETGYSIRAGFDEEGYHIFEIFDIKNPTAYSVFIEPKVSVSDRTAIKSILRDDKAGVVIITVADGTPYKFRLQNSIGTLTVLSENLYFTQPGDTTKINIRVEPGNFFFNYDITDAACDISLTYVNGNKALNNGTLPVKMIGIEPLKNSVGTVLEGYYTITLTDTGDNLLTYVEDVKLTMNYQDELGENQTILSNIFTLRYLSQLPLVLKTDIPIIEITTPATITSKDDWMDDCYIKISNAGKYDAEYTKVQMKGRGNSTWGLPKNPYAIKLDKKAEVLGFPKHKRWVLLANWYDKSNLRSEVAFLMGRMSTEQTVSGMDYTPRITYARVFINGNFQGLYSVTEQLKIDDNRVDVGDDGYLMEIDGKLDMSDINFKIPHIGQPIVIKDPDMESQEQIDYIVNFMNTADKALFANYYLDPENGYKKYIDVYSFIDWYLVNEIAKNADAVFYSSCYMNLKRGDKLRMGPLWDFDLGFANYVYSGNIETESVINSPKGFYIRDVSWYSRMFTDPEFIHILKNRFNHYYDRQQEIYDYIDLKKEFIRNAVHENDKVWHIYSNPFDQIKIDNSFDNDCEKLKSWLQQRLNWLKSEFDNL